MQREIHRQIVVLPCFNDVGLRGCIFLFPDWIVVLAAGSCI